jgi:hypothetical protein
VDELKAGGAVKDQLGETAKVSKTRRGTVDTIMDLLQVGSLEQPEVRKRAFLARRAGKHLCKRSASSHALRRCRLPITRRIAATIQ